MAERGDAALRSRVGRGDRLALAALAALTLVKYFGVAIGRAVFAVGDHSYVNIPLRAAARAAVQQGDLPLWSKALACGTPLLAQGEASVFYPGNLLTYLPVDLLRAYGWTVLVHHVLLGWSTHALLRLSGARARTAAVLSALVMLAPYVLYNLPTSNFFQSFWLAPATLACWEVARRGRPVLGGTLAAACVGLNLLLGRPELVAYTWTALGVVALAQLLASADRRAALRTTVLFGALGVAGGVGLGAVQLLPTVEFIPASTRTLEGEGDLRAHGAWLTPRRSYSAVLFPCFPRDAADYNFYGTGNAYLGIVPVTLALAAGLGSVRKRWRQDLPHALAAVACLVLAFGPNAAVSSAVTALPPFSQFRYPGRALVVVFFFVAVLAARAWDRWEDGESPPRWLLAAVGAVLAAAGVLFALDSADYVRPLVPAGQSLLQLGLLVAGGVAAARGVAGGRSFGVLAACAVQALPMVVGYGNFARPRAEVLSALALLDPIAAAPEGLRRTLVPNVRVLPVSGEGDREHAHAAWSRLNAPVLGNGPMMAGADVVNEFTAFGWGRWRRFVVATLRRHVTGEAPLPPERAVVEFVGLNWLIVPVGERVLGSDWIPAGPPPSGAAYRPWRRATPAPVVSLVHRSELVPDLTIDELVARVRRRPPGHDSVVLEDASAPVLRGRGAPGDEVTALPAGERAFRHRVRVVSEAYLVVRDNDGPGWRATLDGTPVPHYRADGLFKAVLVPPGEHVVELVYRPRSFVLGAAVTAVSLVALAAAAIVAWRGRR